MAQHRADQARTYSRPRRRQRQPAQRSATTLTRYVEGALRHPRFEQTSPAYQAWIRARSAR